MSGTVRIINVSRGMFRDKITVQAINDCEVVWDSLMGARKFYLLRNNRRRVHINKRLFNEGEEVPFKQICTSSNAFGFAWQWHY